MLSKTMLTTATTLYASPIDIESHCIRMIVIEKDIPVNQYLVSIDQMPSDILELNPYQLLPVLFDRKMMLYDFSVIAEYLDERFPFPPLMPVDPVERAEKRLLLFRFMRTEDSLLKLANRILSYDNREDVQLARRVLTNHLVDLTPLFAAKRFFRSDEMTIVDVLLATILWRLDKMLIKLPSSSDIILKYANRLFTKESFQASLSNLESEYRKD